MHFKLTIKPKESFILAFGAESKNTVSYCKDGIIHVSECFGNTFYLENLEKHKAYVNELIKEHGKPDLILYDSHPGYNVSVFAKELAKRQKIKAVPVQHHIAHLYSVALEHDIKDFVGFAADGTGYGENNEIWGGELFKNTERIGHLEEQELIGGESAILRPAKLLYAIARKFLKGKELEDFTLNYMSKEELKMISRQDNILITTSTGRLFDAASVMLGFTDHKDEQNDPAVILSNYAGHQSEDIEPIVKNNILMTTAVFEWLYKSRIKDKSILAASFQTYLAKGIWKLLSSHSSHNYLFSGGVAYNVTIREYLKKNGVLFNKKLPYGDENVSAGQIYYYLANPRH